MRLALTWSAPLNSNIVLGAMWPNHKILSNAQFLVRRAKVAAPPVSVPQGDPFKLGLLAELVRSKFLPTHVTTKELKVWVSGSYVNDPAVGNGAVPVKLIVYVTASLESARATGAPRARLEICNSTVGFVSCEFSTCW